MRRVLGTIVLIAWGLWFGGLMTLMLAVASIFTTLSPDRALAGRVASGVFHWFERYQLAIAALALLSAFAWRISKPQAARSILFALLGLATVGAVVSSAVLTPRIEALRQQDQTQTPQFRRLHHTSTAVYSAQAVVMLFAGIALYVATTNERDLRDDSLGRLS